MSRIIPILAIILLMIDLSAGISDKRIVLASEVEATIRAGEPAQFDNCAIDGYLDLSGVKIEQPVHFNSTVFQSSVTFGSVIFNGDATSAPQI